MENSRLLETGREECSCKGKEQAEKEHLLLSFLFYLLSFFCISVSSYTECLQVITVINQLSKS